MTTKHILLAIAATSLLSFTGGAYAADASDAGRTLPDICKADAMNMAGPMKLDTMPPDPAHKDLMQGMDHMNTNMMQGMTAHDIDVAFVCGMIPHHQGAIDMAKAELAHGDDAWAKGMAQKVIDAQTKEIADMLDWLAKQPK
jgi:uncharacterized protein (DUF305 family)